MVFTEAKPKMVAPENAKIPVTNPDASEKNTMKSKLT